MTTVKVFSTPVCPWCKKAKDWLKEHKIKFEDIDVSIDRKAREEMIDKSGQMGVPVIMIGKEVIVGFDEDAMKKALKVK
jgi:glutaredoxin-like YruB-family protein